VILVGLTGGIASGKSTVAQLLEAKGAVVIDADRISREILAMGRPAYEKVVERFGSLILAGDGSIDRTRLGEIVFADAEARQDLEALTHPEILEEVRQRIAEAEQDRVVVLDAPLIVEAIGRRGRVLDLDALVVVAAAVEDQLERLAKGRDMPPEDARARMSAQAPVEHKLAAADYVIDNRGTLADLRKSVDLLWKDLQARYRSRLVMKRGESPSEAPTAAEFPE
jgi:dephospho-CoA kinase